MGRLCELFPIFPSFSFQNTCFPFITCQPLNPPGHIGHSQYHTDSTNYSNAAPYRTVHHATYQPTTPQPYICQAGNKCAGASASECDTAAVKQLSDARVELDGLRRWVLPLIVAAVTRVNRCVVTCRAYATPKESAGSDAFPCPEIRRKKRAFPTCIRCPSFCGWWMDDPILSVLI